MGKEHNQKKAKLVETKGKLSKRKKRTEEENEVFAIDGSQQLNKDEHGLDRIKSDQTLGNRSSVVKAQSETAGGAGVEEALIGKRFKIKKVEKVAKVKRSDLHISEKESQLEDILNTMDAEKVDEILSVVEDCSRVMKKWLHKYKESRPGLKILQQRIDEFMTVYEAQQEQERREKEARAAEGGWTVVVHHKGKGKKKMMLKVE